jgi:hypothetical protein
MIDVRRLATASTARYASELREDRDSTDRLATEPKNASTIDAAKGYHSSRMDRTADQKTDKEDYESHH